MSDDELDKLLKNGDITLTRVIDRIIALNGIIGVGYISLADDVSKYINDRGHEWAQKHSTLRMED
jgi:hypothetical protein